MGTRRAKLGLILLLAASVAEAQTRRPTVQATFQYHQLTKLPPGTIHIHEGGRIGFNGHTVAYSFTPRGKMGEVWAVSFDGANPELLDRYREDYPGGKSSSMVDISLEGPTFVLHSNGQNLRMVPLDNVGRKAGESREFFLVDVASIINIRMAGLPWVLLHRDGQRVDVKPNEPVKAGVNIIDPGGGKPRAVLTADMVAELVSCEPGDVSFSGGGRFHFDVSLNNRVVAALHIAPRDKKFENRRGSYLVGLDLAKGRPFVIASKTGPDSKYTYPRITISPDGGKIAYINGAEGHVYIADFDGKNAKLLLKQQSKIGFPDASGPFQLDFHGEYLLVGSTGLLLKTDGSYVRGLGNSPRTYSMMGWTAPKAQMGLYPDRFVYQWNLDSSSQLVTVEMNSKQSHSGTPYITKFELEPMALPAKGGEGVIARAWVPQPEPAALKGVTASASQNGVMDQQVYFSGMKDDGNKNLGDKAGDRIYSDVRGPLPEEVTGTRTVRFDAEAEDANGMRHAYAIEFGPVPIRKIEKAPSTTANGTDVVAPAPLGDDNGGPDSNDVASNDNQPGGGGTRTDDPSANPDGSSPDGTGPGGAGPGANRLRPPFDDDIIIASLPAPRPNGIPDRVPYGDRDKFILQAGDVRVRAGQEVRVPIHAWNAAGTSNLNVSLSYDAAVAQPTGIIDGGSIVSGALFEANAKASDGVRLAFAQDRDITVASGTLGYVTFAARGKPGDRTALDLNVTTANNAAGDNRAVHTISGGILIVDPSGLLPGDANGDNEVNELDARSALKMSVQLIPEALQVDVDNSGEVTSRDATLILQSSRRASQTAGG